jgi:glycosidase
MQNLLDSHDTDRFASSIVNPDLPYDGGNRIQDNGPKYNNRKPTAVEWQRMRQAVAVQMTWVGAPMIYYGDEAGMWSPDDPSNRQPMIWKDLGPYDDPQVKFDQTQFNAYQRLIAIRRYFDAPLATGMYRPVLLEDAASVFAFSRQMGDQNVIVAVNRSDKPQVVSIPVTSFADGAKLINLMDPSSARVIPVDDKSNEESDVRPELVIQPAAKQLVIKDGKCRVPLAAWGSAVLVEAPK